MFRSRPRSRRRDSPLTALVGGVATVAVVFAVVGVAGAEPSSFLGGDGHAWRALTEGEKLALLTGFLVGGAFEHALSLSPGQTELSASALEAMRREGRVRFPFTPAVYKARLEDFYFYQDRLPVPIYHALFVINEQIRRGAR